MNVINIVNYKFYVMSEIRKIHQFVTKIKNHLISINTNYYNQPLSEDSLKWLLSQTRYVFLNEESLIKTTGPINICGDLHGQYSDLLNIFNKLGYPSRNNRYIFLGDYVDRGRQSIETFCLLICYKLLYPYDIYLLRGNHETSGISKIYGFYDECKRRYSIKMWRNFVDVFNCMPIAASIGIYENSPLALCMHGGISPHLKNLNDIVKINRPTDVPDEGLLCDLLWSDPDDQYRSGWNENERGVSYVFGRDVLRKFMENNHLELIVRAHQVVEDGYEFFSNRSLITIFSASHYCGEFDNLGGVLSLDKNLRCSLSVFGTK